MAKIQFEWDETKNHSNLRKHGVTFEDASEIFRDPLRVTRPDRIVDGEERWQTIGSFEGLLLLLVVHLIWDTDEGDAPIEIVRIISARRLTAKEKRKYEENGELHA